MKASPSEPRLLGLRQPAAAFGNAARCDRTALARRGSIIPNPPPGTAGCYPESGSPPSQRLRRTSRLPQSKAFGEGALDIQFALQAFQEVEATLAADRSLAIQEKFLNSEVERASLAEKQAERDYAEGINPNILSVLEAQRRANNARAAIIRLRNQRLQNRFDLHLALGGDFRTGGGTD